MNPLLKKVTFLLVLFSTVLANGLFLIVRPQTVSPSKPYYFPILIPEISSDFEVGVRKESKYTLTYENLQSFERRFTNSHSYETKRGVSITQTDKRGRAYSQTTTPQPPPLTPGSWFQMVVSAFAGDYKPMGDATARDLDYSGSEKTDWKETYISEQETSTTNSFSEIDSASEADSSTFLNSVKETQTKTDVIDINTGYIKCGIRLKNFNKSTVVVVDPTFAIYFLVDGQPNLMGIAKAFRTSANSREDIVVPGGGQQGADLRLELLGLNYEDLIAKYTNASAIQLILQSPFIADAPTANPIVLEQRLRDYRDTSVLVSIKSDRIDEQAFITPSEDSGLTIAQAVNGLRKEVAFQSNDLNSDALLSITKIKPDANKFKEQKLSTTMSIEELIGWRSWIAVVKGADGEVIQPFHLNDKLKPGDSLYLTQLTAKDVLGAAFRPVIYSKKGVQITSNSPTILTEVNLKSGDRIVLTNIKLEYLKRDSVNYVKHYSGSIPRGTEFTATRRCDNYEFHFPQTSQVFYIYSPYSVETIEMKERDEFDRAIGVQRSFGLSGFFDVPDMKGLRQGYDLEADIGNLFLAGQLRKFIPADDRTQIMQWASAVDDSQGLSLETVVTKNSQEGNKVNWILPIKQSVYRPFLYWKAEDIHFTGIIMKQNTSGGSENLGAEIQRIFVKELGRTYTSARPWVCGMVPQDIGISRSGSVRVLPLYNQSELDSAFNLVLGGGQLPKDLPPKYSEVLGSRDLLKITADVEVLREGR